MNAEKLSALLRAADEHKDCHHVMSDGKFCVYLEPAHHSKLIDHPFISLASLLREVADGWQPIETAPKDGTNVLLPYCEWVAQAYYVPDLGDWISFAHGKVNSPTHWMPLPKPPERKEEK